MGYSDPSYIFSVGQDPSPSTPLDNWLVLLYPLAWLIVTTTHDVDLHETLRLDVVVVFVRGDVETVVNVASIFS